MGPRIDSLLVATDGSDAARRAARHAVALAASIDADELHALSVVPKEAIRTTRAALDEDGATSALEAERERAASVVTDFAEAYPSAPEVTEGVRSGPPHQEITAYADEHGVDVVVMGTEGRSGLDRVLLGSVTERVLRTSNRPVLAVPPGAGGPDTDETSYDEVLLPTDGSEGATEALEWTIELGTAFGAPLHALFAADASPIPTAIRSEEVLDELEEEGNQALATARERAEDEGVDVTTTVTTDAPAETTLEYVDEEPIDLIAMGTHGRSGVGRLLLGSVTEEVVRHSDVPVFCVPAPDDGG